MNDLLNRTLTDMKVEIDIPVKIYWEQYGTPKYWKLMEQELQHEIDDIQEFIRDHRSRDHYGLFINKIYIMTCKYCGREYSDDYDGIVDCCEKALCDQEERIKGLQPEQ